MNISYVRFIHTIGVVSMSGRPRKYDGPVKRFEAWIPYDIYQEMENEKLRRGISWPELVLDMWETYKAARE